jgi:hypothetical protein
MYEKAGKNERLEHLDGPNFDGFIVRCSKKGCVVVAELVKEETN